MSTPTLAAIALRALDEGHIFIEQESVCMQALQKCGGIGISALQACQCLQPRCFVALSWA
jgi:hypothetical protein